MTISREKLKLMYAERRERREGARWAYELACKTDLNQRPKFVKRRTLKRGNRPFAIRRFLLQYRAVELAKKDATSSPG